MRRAALLVFLLAAAPAGAHPSHGPIPVRAEGNPLQGGLRFAPAGVSAEVGDRVEWTNADSLVEHSAVEAGGLWEQRMPPGVTAGRAFEAGTHAYLCRFHPQMRGEVAVAPLTYLDVRYERYTTYRWIRRGRKKRRVKLRGLRERRVAVVVWAAGAPQGGRGFDVERRRSGGAWGPLATGTQGTGAEFPAGPRGTSWEIRVRTRSGEHATGWSPVAGITS